MTAQEIIRELPKGLIKWYTFQKNKKALYVACGTQIDSAMAEAMCESGLDVDNVTVSELEDISQKRYDYIVLTSVIEQTKDIEEAIELLTRICSFLKEDGKLLIGANNRLGIRYFCGDKDIYTGRNFDSIENYVRADNSVFDHMKGRSYAKTEIKEILEKSGILQYRFFSVFPVLERPQIIFSDDYKPNEQLDIRIFPQYNCADTVFLEEERLYDTLIKNDMFHTLANAFWIECGFDGVFSNVNQVTMSMDRGREHAMFTILHKDDRVEKRAVYKEGKAKLKSLLENRSYLEQHHVLMVPMKMENNACVMPYIEAMSTLEFLRNLLVKDKKEFLEELNRFWEIILHSSEHAAYEEIDWERYEPEWEKRPLDDPNRNQWRKLAFGTPEEQDSIGVILKRGYIDLIPLNSFYDGKEYIFYDQELYVENLPAKAILLRTIEAIYRGNTHLDHILPIRELKEAYGLLNCAQLFYEFISKFLKDLRNDNILRDYHRRVRRNAGMIHANRQRMNYSVEEYEKIFRDIFRGAESRRLYLFGSGQFAEMFLSQFHNDYDIVGILDNNPDKWGTDLGGVPIYSPEIIKTQEQGTYKIIICIKNYIAVMQQLMKMQVTDFGVYDCNLSYSRQKSMIVKGNDSAKQEKKKYNVGYIAGVFDLFHIGHLNMFKRAKEQCNYLIVGVVTDEGVIKNKHTNPFVPFEERIEMVRSCRYVDEAVEIPLEHYNTDEAYRRYQFDVQFSGSDYANDPGWIAKKEFLQKKGSDMVFFPYTQSTSSTKIKDLINKRLV